MASGIIDEITHESCFVLVGSYNRFDNLAHRPRGTPAQHGLRVYSMNTASGKLTLVHIVEDEECQNPAFMRYHPQRNVVYAVTEDVNNEGRLIAYGTGSNSGRLRKLGSIGAGGKSTCYISPSHDAKHLLLVNYWDSTVSSIRLNEGGIPQTMVQNLPCGVKTAAKPQQHGDDPHGKHRQHETHAHALVLDPMYSRVAYVPDLGEDVIKQFVFDPSTGELQSAGQLPAGIGEGPHGPRYIEFHPWLNCAYVVNELGSTIDVFEFDDSAAAVLQAGDEKTKTLLHVQQVRTIPMGFAKHLNTCGRITVHESGKYVLVSNRGHDSIAVFEVHLHMNAGMAGQLSPLNFCHTGGRTPRHFKFDHTGKWLLAANQDSDSIAVFAFDLDSGDLQVKHSYHVPSPNFVATRISQVTATSQRRLAMAKL